ncbi:MAG TPA: hypothetical protein VGM20_04200 [Gemmatimonadales bacterium]|jgi:hypothetical protein
MTAAARYAIDRTLPLLGDSAVAGAAASRTSHAILIDENVRLRTENAVHAEREQADAKLLRKAAAQLVVHKLDAGALQLRLEAREIEIERRDERIAFLEAELALLGATIPAVVP